MSTDLVPADSSTDLVRADANAAHALSLSDQWKFAETVANSSMVPKAYRGDPGGVLIAVNLGQQMGLSPAESMYRIHVIEGKPSASAELIASNVRRAGHKIRIHATNESATVRITRADEPDYPSEVTWTIEDAKRAELTGKDNWRKYPRSMLRARAISECAREACPEALYGVTYVEGEVVESVTHDVITATAARESAADALAPPQQDAAAESADSGGGITDAQHRKLGVLFREAEITDADAARQYCADVIGREIGSRKEMTSAEAGKVIDSLETEAKADPDTGEISQGANDGKQD